MKRRFSKVFKSDADCFEGVYKNHDIFIHRGLRKNFYIMVESPSGLYAYDGYWRDSADRSIDEAIEEALRGAGLA